MIEAQASSVKIIDAPRLSVARLLVLRALVDSVITSSNGLDGTGHSTPVLDVISDGSYRAKSYSERSLESGAAGALRDAMQAGGSSRHLETLDSAPSEH